MLAFVAVIGLPLAVRRGPGESVGADVPRLIIVTPHVQQIRVEFSQAFSEWHERHYDTPVKIDWRVPGGTSEIVRQLQAQFNAAIKDGRIHADGTAEPGSIGYDIMFGGGSYDHSKLHKGSGVLASPPGSDEAFSVPMSAPGSFTQEQLDEWFGENKVGAGLLYDPEQYWIGTALSTFGIVYNRDVLSDLGLAEPTSFKDLTDPRYQSWIALCDPRQSGSITTTLDSILNNKGWDDGWRLLRELCANTRYFTPLSTKPPIDVSQGEAAAGLAIDFYGRGQAQSIVLPGEDPAYARVGFVDPAGAVFVDADPVSVIRGGPSPELAWRFVEYCMTEEAQSLWQFRSVNDPHPGGSPIGEDGKPMGPKFSALRRMPAQRRMYEKYMPYMVDQVNPFDIASDVRSKGWRGALGIMMGGFGIDTSDSIREAWAALSRARAEAGFDPMVLVEMENLFYAFPPLKTDGGELAFTPENYKAFKTAWRKPGMGERFAIEYAKFFKQNYERVVELEHTASRK